mmetsp:Transcript_23598/g.26210  ORF Transcript_23598/g.26210 Transcript_23598/m.26210 type:complete len:178 (+) Transcript_23598:100-633(+)
MNPPGWGEMIIYLAVMEEFVRRINPCKIAEKGEFLFQKQQYINTIPTIHSKSLNYYANGTGRDSYISSSAGGLTKMNRPGEFRATFYNGLRSQDNLYTPKRCRSGIATKKQKGDFYTKSQSFKSHKNFNIQKSYRAYQKHLDGRLSRPKTAQNLPRYTKVKSKFSKSSVAYGRRERA